MRSLVLRRAGRASLRCRLRATLSSFQSIPSSGCIASSSRARCSASAKRSWPSSNTSPPISRGFTGAHSSRALERIAKRIFKDCKPRFEIPPLAESFTIQRLANLLGAGGAHIANRRVELNAPGLELEAAEVENAPHIAVEIIDEVLMMDAKHPSWQNPVPVAHQFQIGAVVTRDILDAVGEFLPVG